MGPCCSSSVDVEDAAWPCLLPSEIEATLPDGGMHKIWLASASYCYCLLISGTTRMGRTRTPQGCG